jgi:putative dehydrogenase
MRVGVIGLGSMGMGAALSLLSAGVEVTGCDPRATARDEFSAAAWMRWSCWW